MSNIKEQIRQEIERLRKDNEGIRCKHNERYCAGYDDALSDLLAFIDSQSEEKPSEDLEEAAENLFETIEIQEHENIFEDTFKKIFIAGAEWQKQRDAELIEIAYNDGITIGKTKQKEQMMKDAVEGDYDCQYMTPAVFLDKYLDGIKDGDKVRIIIVKED